MTIDIKSLAVGLILGISIAFSIAANDATKSNRAAVSQYRVINASWSSLHEKVEERLKDGWALQGGVSIDGGNFSQAIVK